MSNIYRGRVTNDHRFEVTKNDEPLRPKRSQNIRNHSPDGFAWSYEGSGPAQLALEILLEETSKEEAMSLYQCFKREVVAKFNEDGFIIRSSGVQDWLRRKRDGSQESLEAVNEQ